MLKAEFVSDLLSTLIAHSVQVHASFSSKVNHKSNEFSLIFLLFLANSTFLSFSAWWIVRFLIWWITDFIIALFLRLSWQLSGERLISSLDFPVVIFLFSVITLIFLNFFLVILNLSPEWAFKRVFSLEAHLVRQQGLLLRLIRVLWFLGLICWWISATWLQKWVNVRIFWLFLYLDWFQLDETRRLLVSFGLQLVNLITRVSVCFLMALSWSVQFRLWLECLWLWSIPSA